MKNKKKFTILITFFLVVIIIYLLSFFVGDCVPTYQTNCCFVSYAFNVSFSTFMADILLVFFAMLFWFISPIGILLLLGIKLFFSENASKAKKNFAILIQFLSFLSWLSLMFILIIVYIDSKSYQVLSLGGEMLNLAIKSGFGFVIFMIMLALAEKKILGDQNFKSENIESKKNNIKQNKNKKEKDSDESVKNNRIKSGGIKDRIKNRIKEEIKKVIDNKIDKL
ncbi:MAG: hypothetical protein KAS01_01590 [Candidatus Pacebacteria bacterium]|nr:hypothetical protein [Candidatus Paceibacterota bacterium]